MSNNNIIELNKVYDEALNSYLFYTARYHRLNDDILNGADADILDFQYKDIYEQFKNDHEFSYFEEYAYIKGAHTALSGVFGNILKLYYKATAWKVSFSDPLSPCQIYATINGYDCKVFDYCNSVDRARLDERTCKELELLFNGPDITGEYL